MERIREERWKTMGYCFDDLKGLVARLITVGYEVLLGEGKGWCFFGASFGVFAEDIDLNVERGTGAKCSEAG